MKCTRFVTFAFLHGLSFISLIKCEENDNYEDYFKDPLIPEDVVDPHSRFYDVQTKQMLKHVQVDAPVKENTEISSATKFCTSAENDSTHEAVFYKRLVNLLLANIHVQDKDNILMSGILEIEISYADMETLKNFPMDGTSLREIDEILSKSIRKPRYDYINRYGVRYILEVLQQGTSMLFTTVKNNPEEAIIVLVILMLFSTLRIFKWDRSHSAVGFMQIAVILFVISFFMTWLHLLQEAEAKNMADQGKYAQIPVSCQPDKMSYLDKFLSLFHRDDCEEYYKTVMSNPKLKVTPAHVLSYLITSVVLDPVTQLGRIISAFIQNATEDLSFLYAWIVKCILYLAVGIAIIMTPLWLSGASIYLPFGFGIGYLRNKNQGNSLPSIEKREPVQIFLQVSQGTGVARATDTLPEAERLKALEDVKPESENVTDNVVDFSGGDASNKTRTVAKIDSSEECERERMKEHDGSGDN